MRKPLILSLGILLTAAGAAAADPFENKAIQLGSEIVANPAAFFFDFQQDMESTNPLPPTKRVGLNWHLGQFLPIIPPYLILPIPDPTTPNLSAKFKVFRENGLFPGMPQIDAVGGFWTLGPVLKGAIDENAATCEDPNCEGPSDPGRVGDPLGREKPDSELKKAEFGGNYYGLIATTSLEPRVRLYYGYKQSSMKAKLELNRPVDLQGSKVTKFDTEYEDKFLFAGLEHPTSPKTFWLLQMSYGLKQKSLMAKVSWYRKYMELSLNIYPEGVLVIHPSLNFHFNFF